MHDWKPGLIEEGLQLIDKRSAEPRKMLVIGIKKKGLTKKSSEYIEKKKTHLENEALSQVSGSNQNNLLSV